MVRLNIPALVAQIVLAAYFPQQVPYAQPNLAGQNRAEPGSRTSSSKRCVTLDPTACARHAGNGPCLSLGNYSRRLFQPKNEDLCQAPGK